MPGAYSYPGPHERLFEDIWAADNDGTIEVLLDASGFVSETWMYFYTQWMWFFIQWIYAKIYLLGHMKL